MSGAAQRSDMVGTFDFPLDAGESTAGLKQAVAERLAAHRSRRAEQALEAAQEAAATRRERSEARRGIARVRDAVAARFENSPSYREFLTAEAERALQQAQAEAEIAARNARAVAEAQMQLLEELEQWKQPESGPREIVLQEEKIEARHELAHALADIALGARELIQESLFEAAVSSVAPAEAQVLAPVQPQPKAEVPAGGLTVRLYEEIGTSRPAPAELRMHRASQPAHQAEPDAPELGELEEEIEFRHAPEFGPHVIETTPIPANLIEFPRQLIAPRKARPRLAEGPLREDVAPAPQLRIFEVEPEQISVQPEIAEAAGVAEWQTLMLDGDAAYVPAAPAEAQVHFTMEPQTAPLELRLMAAAVDGCCLLVAFLGFAALVFEITNATVGTLPRPLMIASSAGVLLAMFVLYQMLFFSLAEATPGMRYARIGLCTFSDENPTRKAMRRRVFAMFLAACPLAIGLAWTFLDDQRLGWHDRMSKMYPRAY